MKEPTSLALNVLEQGIENSFLKRDDSATSWQKFSEKTLLAKSNQNEFKVVTTDR